MNGMRRMAFPANEDHQLRELRHAEAEIVSVDENQAAAAVPPAAIDPFSFHPGSVSRIEGLGGDERPPANDYVFHTPYVAAASGHVHFIARFTGLRAKRGTLQLRVHMLPDGPGAVARVANSARISLSRLIKNGGETALRFEGFRGVRFALHGTISDETDAAAESLVVILDHPPGPDEQGPVVEARSTDYGREATRATGHLHALRAASLKHPVCQAFTMTQMDEPIAKTLAHRLALQTDNPTALWSALFIARALDEYGLARPGARGLCLGPVSMEVIEELLRTGCDLTVAGQPANTRAFAEREGLTLIDTDPVAAVRELLNFDFVCSNEAADHPGSIAERIDYLGHTIQSLRPGGLAVHVVPFLSRRKDLDPDPAYFDRGSVERLALILISRGHEVAQLLLDGTGTGGESRNGMSPTAFGIIARRAPSAL